MSANRLILVAGLGSLALLVGAFVFQGLGWAPCKMCLWQRWPHVVAVLAAGLLLGGVFLRGFATIGLGALLTSVGLAAYHSGVELKWWPGPTSCSGAGPGLSGLSGADLVPGASPIPALVMCDTLTPFFLGLTMANWNLLASLGLTVIWSGVLLRTVLDGSPP